MKKKENEDWINDVPAGYRETAKRRLAKKREYWRKNKEKKLDKGEEND